MMTSRCLIAIDCSDQSLELVRYFSRLFPPEHHEAVLFHVSSSAPDALLDVGEDAEMASDMLPIRNWIATRQAYTKLFQERSKQLLVDAGFKPDAITIKSQTLKHGIARDILAESHNGYTMLLIGRSEPRPDGDRPLGSVATKLVSKCDHIPIAVVGGEPNADKIFIGFDHSDGAMHSVCFLGTILKNTNTEITLCHVIRSLKLKQIKKNNDLNYQNIFTPEHEYKWQVITEKKIRPILDRAIGRLNEAGWPLFKIHRKIIVDVDTRSQSLVEEARSGDHGTIVLGRRGASVVREFFLGRVSRKVLEKADAHAVWVV